MYTVTANYHKMDVEVKFNQSFGKKGVCLILSLPNVGKGKFRPNFISKILRSK